MSLPPEAIKELQEIVYRKKGKELSDEAAMALGIKLIALYKVIYRPLPDDFDINSLSKSSEI